MAYPRLMLGISTPSSCLERVYHGTKIARTRAGAAPQTCAALPSQNRNRRVGCRGPLGSTLPGRDHVCGSSRGSGRRTAQAHSRAWV